MGPLAWLTMSSRKRLAGRALRAISEIPLLLLSSSSRVMIGRNTSCSSNRNRLVGSCISTLVSRTKSFVADCDLVRREGTDLCEASAAESACWSDGFNKIEHLLGVAGNFDSAPLAPENAVAVEHEGAALDAPYFFPVKVLHFHHPELAADFLGLVGKQLEGKSHLRLEILVRLETVARDSGYRTSRLLELGVEIAKLRAFRGAARTSVRGSGEKFCKLPQQFRGRFLRDVMAAIQGSSLDGLGPLGPVGEGGEAARYRSVLAPQNEQRRRELA